jgi:inosose dehydratase
MKLAAAPISWGVCEVPGWGFQLGRDDVLADAARLGLRDIEAGPPGFLPADAREARELVDGRGMRVVGGFVAAVLHSSERLEADLVALDAQAEWLAALGAEVLVLAAATGRDGYNALAEPTIDEWKTLLASLPRASEIAKRHGLDTAFHPHVGSVVESRESIDRILRESDIPLCLDTGHIFVGGGDPAAIAREHPDRIRHVHLKDADGALAAAVRDRRIAYADAVARGLFRPLGQGGAGIADVLRALKASGYSGWGVLEQDIALREAPTDANDPAKDVARSRDFANARG